MADSNIRLRDAEGREIPLNTKVLYDSNGDSIAVSRYQLYPNVGRGCWNLRSVRGKYYRADEVYLTPPDSWEKLLEDLNNVANAPCSKVCAYYDVKSSDCSFCPAVTEDSCVGAIFKNIAARIRKLRGEGE